MTKQTFILTFLLAFSQVSRSADIENGKLLHDDNCVRCHKPMVYNNEKSSINSFTALKNRVQFCEVSNDLTWFEEDVDDVVEYLNVNFYQFDMK